MQHKHLLGCPNLHQVCATLNSLNQAGAKRSYFSDIPNERMTN